MVTSPLTDNNEVITDIMISILTHVFTQLALITFLALIRNVTSFNLTSYLQSTATINNKTSPSNKQKPGNIIFTSRNQLLKWTDLLLYCSACTKLGFCSSQFSVETAVIDATV